jgi:hypothetical protein
MARQASDNNDRVLRARMAAHLLHAQITDEAAHTAPARAAFLSRFEREVDPDGILDPQERTRRAEHAKKAYSSSLLSHHEKHGRPSDEQIPIEALMLTRTMAARHETANGCSTPPD